MAIKFPFVRRNQVEVKEDINSSKLEYDFPDIEMGNFIDLSSFSKFRSLSNDRVTQYSAYDNMAQDTIISSALEMYADDASQFDAEGRLIWVTSSDDKLQSYLNDLVDILDLPSMLWGIYYSLAEYGDVYLRLYKKTDYSGIDGDKNSLLEDQSFDANVPYSDYVELVDDPENVYELVKNGKTAQYAYLNKEAGRYKNERIELYPPDQFIHIYIPNPQLRDREDFEFRAKDPDTGKEVLYRYKVRRGKSMLHDIYETSQELKLIEVSLLLNRLSRSAITRIVSLEVGDMPSNNVRNKVRKLKSALESKLAINEKSGVINSYNSPSGIDNILINTTRNGKGNISIDSVGGDVDVKSLMDLDYFTNKLFGGLKIPKAFLGFDDSLSANSGGTLIKMDARYGRTIKRLQSRLLAGLKDLFNYYLIHSGQSNSVNNFTVHVVSPSTVEDSDRESSTSNNLDMIGRLLQVLGDSNLDNTEVVKYMLKKYMKDPELSDIIDKSKSSGSEY